MILIPGIVTLFFKLAYKSYLLIILEMWLIFGLRDLEYVYQLLTKVEKFNAAIPKFQLFSSEMIIYLNIIWFFIKFMILSNA